MSFTFLAYKFWSLTWISRAILEELSNQRRSKKTGDGKEMKETEPNVLQRQRNKGGKRLRKQRERDCARRAAQTASERQATSQQKSRCECERMTAETREKQDYGG